MTEDRVPSRRFMRGASARPRTRLGVGLVGLGRLGRIYARDLAARIPDVRLTAVADTDPAVLDLIACEYDVSRAHPDPAGLIRDPVVDAIVIASRAISTDILKFRARVLVIHVAERRRERATLITVLPMYSFRPRRSASPGQSSQAPAWRVLVVGRRSTDRDQAAASIAGHVRQAAIGWPQRGPGVQRPRVTSGLLEPCPQCRSTSRQVSVRETPNAGAPGCVRGRRTRLVDGRWSRCPTAWTLTRPWTDRARSTASWKTTEPFSTSAHTDSFTQSTPGSPGPSAATPAPGAASSTPH
jgi:hypothetical protein